jgi:hypothetical protein
MKRPGAAIFNLHVTRDEGVLYRHDRRMQSVLISTVSTVQLKAPSTPAIVNGKVSGYLYLFYIQLVIRCFSLEHF